MRAPGVGLKVKSKALNAIIEEVPKKLLFHYTDQACLLGIIKTFMQPKVQIHKVENLD
jgi:hypothetical protein